MKNIKQLAATILFVLFTFCSFAQQEPMVLEYDLLEDNLEIGIP